MPTAIGADTSPPKLVVALAMFEYKLKSPTPSERRTRYRYAVEADSPVLEYDSAVVDAICVKEVQVEPVQRSIKNRSREFAPPGLPQVRLICEVEAVTAVKPVGVEDSVPAEAGTSDPAKRRDSVESRIHNRGRHICSSEFLILNGAPFSRR